MQGTASLGTGNAVLLGGTLSDQYIPVQYQTLTGAKSYTIQSHNGRSARCSFLGHTQLSRPDPAQPVSPDNIQTITPVSNPALLQYSGGAVQISAPNIAPMMALPNGIKDEIAVQGGKWGILRNVAKITFDGANSGWRISGNADIPTYMRFFLSMDNTIFYSYGRIICNYFPESNLDSAWQNPTKETILFAGGKDKFTSNVNIVIKKSRLTGWSDSWTADQKVAAFKTWLAANPITFYYQIVTPIFEPVAAFNGFGYIEPIAPTVTIIKPNPDAPISPDNIAAITGTTVTTQGYQGNVRQIQGDFYSLPNGVADEFDGRKTIYKIAKRVLSAPFKYAAQAGTETVLFVFSAALNGLATNANLNTVMFNRFPTKNSWSDDAEGAYCANAENNIYVRIKKSRLTGWQDGLTDAQKTDLFKNWLAANPIDVYYMALNPTTVYVNADLPLVDGQNTIVCDNSVMQQLTVREIDSRAIPLADEAKFYNDRLGVCPDRNLQTWLESVGKSGTFTVNPNTTTDGKPDIIYGGWYMGTVHHTDDGAITVMLMTTNTTNHVDNRVFRGLCVNGNWAKWQEVATTETGTWAPRLSGTATGGVWAPTSIIATYIKTTKNITVYFFMTGSFTGASGSLQILGLPVVPKDYYGVGTVCYTAGLQATGVTNALNMVELTITNAGAPVQAQSISGTITLCGSCTYNI